MIRYSLQCADGHGFEEWFDSMAEYDRRAAAGELACPDCGSGEVTKAITAPNVARGAAAPAPACAATGGPGCGRCAFDA